MVDNVSSSDNWKGVYQVDGGIAMPSRAPAPDKNSEVSKGFSGENSTSTSEGQPSFDNQSVDVQLDAPRQASLKAQDPAVRDKMQQESANLEQGRQKINNTRSMQYINSDEIHIGDGSALMSLVSAVLGDTYSRIGQQFVNTPLTSRYSSNRTESSEQSSGEAGEAGESQANSNSEKSVSELLGNTDGFQFTPFSENPFKALGERMAWSFSMTKEWSDNVNVKIERDMIAAFQPHRLEKFEAENEVLDHSDIQRTMEVHRLRRDLSWELDMQAGEVYVTDEQRELSERVIKARIDELRRLINQIEGSGVPLTEDDKAIISDARELIDIFTKFDFDLAAVIRFALQSLAGDTQELEDDSDEGIGAIEESARNARREFERLDEVDRERETVENEVEERRINTEQQYNEQAEPATSQVENPLFPQQAAAIPEIVPVEQAVETNAETVEPVSALSGERFLQVDGASSSQPVQDSVPELNSDPNRMLPESDHTDLATVFMPEDTTVLDQLLSALDEEPPVLNDEDQVSFDEGLAIAVKLEAWQQTQPVDAVQPVFQLQPRPEPDADLQSPTVADFLAEVKDIPLKVADQQQEQKELGVMALRNSFV
ncbi:MAG: hypothetical protein ACR2PT_06625 [Endozoicomonas sp.]